MQRTHLHLLAALCLGALFLGTLAAVRGESGQETTARRPATGGSEARAADQPAEPPIDFDRARQLITKRRSGETLTPDELRYLERARAAFQRRPGQDQPTVRATTGLKPLSEMSAEDRYQGEDGGLYGGGANLPPPAHQQAAVAALGRITPRDRAGRPAEHGRVVLVSISMSNATQEFSTFKPLADADPDKSPRLTIVDCAQGGQAMAEWAPPDAAPWQVAERRLTAADVTPPQVQVAWIKLANKGPSGTLQDHGRQLERDTRAVIQNAKRRFPNLQVAYLSSRIYAGYATSRLNPEPYAYESAFVVRWLIQDQVRGQPELNYDPERGDVQAPLLLWGPYLWADGTTPRQHDKLTWTREDLAADGTHPSPAGRKKVAEQLLTFFQTDPLARPWFHGRDDAR